MAVRTAELVNGSTVGIMLADHRNHLRFVAASDEATRLLELFQVQNNQGPCLDAFSTRAPVVNADLKQAADLWPLFAPRATALGLRSVHAIPLRLRSTVIGALNVFSIDAGIVESDDVAMVQALADVATIGLLQQRAISRGEVLTKQLQGHSTAGSPSSRLRASCPASTASTSTRRSTYCGPMPATTTVGWETLPSPWSPIRAASPT